jgi:glucosamine-6-phosphate deaminase
MTTITNQKLYEWCKIPVKELDHNRNLKIPLRLCKDNLEMGNIMARELINLIKENNEKGNTTRAIIPCGPDSWYAPFTQIVNSENVSLKKLVVFHMDECLDWQGNELPINHPYSFRGFMEKYFYEPIYSELSVEMENRNWLNAKNIEKIKIKINEAPIDITYGGWGQDGHVAYNQSRRHPFNHITLNELRESTIRIQENNIDTIIALAHRTFGAAYQFVPPMSVTLGMKECLSANKIRLFSGTGAWKQTALRVALFSETTSEYPITLLQEHNDALLTATIDTAAHPLSEHPEWDLGINSEENSDSKILNRIASNGSK